MLLSRELAGRFGEATVVDAPEGVAARRVVVLGLGGADVLDSFRLHNAYTLAGRELRAHRLARPVLAVDASLAQTAVSNLGALLCAMVTGVLLANHEAGLNKTDS